MNANQCMRILREIKDIAFATVDEHNDPQIRIIDVMLVEDDRLYFLTARGKDFYRELMRSGKIAAAAMTENYEMIRVTGTAVKLPDRAGWIDRMFEENPSMCEVYPGDSRGILEPFCVTDGCVEYFDLSKTPVFRETYPIGGKCAAQKGFFIGGECIGCGQCAKVCPSGCIERAKPFWIREENCLHCGLCAERCPVNAVRRKGV